MSALLWTVLILTVVLIVLDVFVLVFTVSDKRKKDKNHKKSSTSPSPKSGVLTQIQNKPDAHRLAIASRFRAHQRILDRYLATVNDQNTTQKAGYVEYIKSIYPIVSYPAMILKQIQFYFQDILSQDIIDKFGSNYPPPENSSRNYEPPLLHELWVPIWYPPSAFVINGYDPQKFWKGDTCTSYDQRLGEFTEVMHVPDDDQNFYTVFGTWFYVTRGTGVWFNAGPRVLSAQNKLFALRELGLTTWEIANIFLNAQFMINPITYSPSLIELASGQVTSSINFPATEQNQQVANMLHHYFETMEHLINSDDTLSETDLQTLYMLDRINNSANFDETINFLARTQGYNSVQFLVQANGNGGWAHELVFVDQQMFLGTDEKRMATLLHRLFIADPTNPRETKIPCKFSNNDSYSCLSCQQQNIIYSLCNSGASVDASPS